MIPQSTRDIPLPELRPELQLRRGAPESQWQPTWLIHDPLLNRYIQIDAAAHAILSHWQEADTVAGLVARITASGEAQADEKSVCDLINMLKSSELTLDADGRQLANIKAKQRHSLFMTLVHNYLFFRVPLVRPNRALLWALPLVRKLWSVWVLRSIAVMGIAGLYLASRQWELFLTTAQRYMSWEGAISAGAALIIVKILHELGHAFAATALGCRVHTMGIAFVVMAPMPYTDVTDAWKLPRRQQRLIIDSAGILVEAAVAAVALLFWGLLPDGPLRSCAFVLSAVSIISSLAINLNPFMRFDGYYLLTEILGVPNLQARAFALGRWKLREVLFGIGAPCPEQMPRGKIGVLVAYAWAIWIYRLVVFTGIALLVYHYFFKVLGLILFAVEIVYFIIRPIMDELKQWYRMRKLIRPTPRAVATVLSFAVLLAAVVVPWSTRVEIPSVLEAGQLQRIFPVRAAKVVAVHVSHGARVTAGTPIVTLSSSEIDNELSQARISLALADLQLARRGVDNIDRESSLVLEDTVRALRSKIAGLLREQGELQVRAPFDGKIVDLNPEMRNGRWVGPREEIAVLIGESGVVARGYVAEEDVARIKIATTGIFIPEEPMRSRVDVRVEQIGSGGVAEIEIADLASLHQGRIAVTEDQRHKILPSSAHYVVNMTVLHDARPGDLSIRGVVIARGEPVSLLANVWRRALSILVRESGA